MGQNPPRERGVECAPDFAHAESGRRGGDRCRRPCAWLPTAHLSSGGADAMPKWKFTLGGSARDLETLAGLGVGVGEEGGASSCARPCSRAPGCAARLFWALRGGL